MSLNPWDEDPAWKLDANPERYIDRKDGLQAATLADDVLAAGPLAAGADGHMWSYADGVWTQNPHIVRDRVTRLLGNRYRSNYTRNAEDVIRSRSDVITCDPVPQYINFTNGLYEWQTGLLRDHDPEVSTTVQLAVDWQPDATCPEFDKFLAEVLPADMVPMVWELIGYLMYSGNPMHKAVMLMGSGRNGKGTFLRTLTALLGGQNITNVSLQDLASTRFSAASLFGKLANIAGDIDGTHLEATAMFKAITGEDRISAEYKGRDRFDFTPWAVPVFSANKVPTSSDVTTGYLSRWIIVPFPHSFTGNEDRGLSERLTAKSELQGIAAKAVQSLQSLMRRGGFSEPESARDAAEEFARKTDQVRTWADECATIDGESFTPRKDAYAAYRDWADTNGYGRLKSGEFRDRLSGIPGVSAHRLPRDGTRGFNGIKVTDPSGVLR